MPTNRRSICSIFSRWRFISNASGLSTLEYAVLFVVILVGGLSIWEALGSEMLTQVRAGHDRFSAVLSGEQVSTRPLNNTNRSNIGIANDQYSVQSSRSEPVQVVSRSYSDHILLLLVKNYQMSRTDARCAITQAETRQPRIRNGRTRYTTYFLPKNKTKPFYKICTIKGGRSPPTIG